MTTLFEGAKVSHDLINAALTDPRMTMGFEAEFYVTNIKPLLKKVYRQHSKTKNDWVQKPLDKMLWHDLLRRFSPLRVSPAEAEKDNQDVIKRRVMDLFQKVYPNELAKVKFSDAFKRLIDKFKPYHLITALRVWPTNGFDLDQQTTRTVKKLIASGDLFRMSAYKNLDQQDFKLYQPGEESLAFDPNADHVQREVVFHMIADRLSEVMGEEFKVVMDPNQTRAETNGYRTWAIAPDSSLDFNTDVDQVGIEVISPAKQIGESMAALEKFFGVLNNFGQVIPGSQVVTNQNTGFHINIGTRGRKVDFVKLLFLMGDEYIAKNFNRLEFGSSDEAFAAQTYQAMVQNAANRPQVIKLLGQMEKRLQLSQQDIQYVIDQFRQAVPVQKMQSVNLKKLNQGFVEFRSPGNTDYHKNFAQIEQTTQQLAVMMYVATEPQVYRQQFLTKLYKALIAMGKEQMAKLQQPAQRPVMPRTA